MVDKYQIIITNLDAHTIDLEPYQHGGANITTLRMVDANGEPLAAYAEHMKKVAEEEKKKKKEEEEKEKADSENEENPAESEAEGPPEDAEDGGDNKGEEGASENEEEKDGEKEGENEEEEEKEDEEKQDEEEEEEDEGNPFKCRLISYSLQIQSIGNSSFYFSHFVEFNKDSVRLQTALIHDSIVLLADTFKQLGVDQIQPTSLYCKNDSAWEKGLSISNFMRNVNCCLICMRLEKMHPVLIVVVYSNLLFGFVDRQSLME